MKIYLVGGAVRDQLLGLPIGDQDWVVVGATPQEMLDLGYKQVGKDFPVFLHPETHEEYALARTERKSGHGYTGFECDANKHITLEQDLLRRDLTVNAMAMDENNNIIDPYNGQKDLKNKLLRHVSPAFIEDPLRVLRIARFAAQLNFSVAPDTQKLLLKLSQSGELNNLVPERVWQEFSRAFNQQSPENFIRVLKNCHGWEILFPELLKTDLITTNIAVFIYYSAGELALDFCHRLKLPNNIKDQIELLVNNFYNLKKLDYKNPEDIISFLENLDSYRREDRFKIFLDNSEELIKFNKKLLLSIYQKTNNIKLSNYKNLSGKEISEKLNQLRIEAAKHLL